MEQSTSSSFNLSSGCPFHLFSDDEIKVSEILLNLSNLINEFESRPRIMFGWSSKRKRSAVDLNPSSSSLHRCLFCPRSSSSPSLERAGHGESETEKKRANVNDESSSSPMTPLCFLPSESDEKFRHSRKKVSKKPTKEELLGIIGQLTQTRDILKMEIETVKSKCDKLKAVNLEFDSMIRELRSCPMKPHLELSKSINLEIKSSQYIIKPTVCENQNPTQIQITAHQEQCSTVDQTVDVSHTRGDPHGPTPLLLPTGSELGKANLMDPLGIPALNAAAGNTFELGSPQPLDQNRVLTVDRASAAEARRRRIAKRKELRNAAAAAASAVKPRWS